MGVTYYCDRCNVRVVFGVDEGDMHECDPDRLDERKLAAIVESVLRWAGVL